MSETPKRECQQAWEQLSFQESLILGINADQMESKKSGRNTFVFSNNMTRNSG